MTGHRMVDFTECGIEYISHHAPIHYFPFIARSQSLKSKPVLQKENFGNNHFRSLSKRSDVQRGFGKYAFLTLTLQPRIVQAKLKGGFPHITLLVPVTAFDGVKFDLCRYNVAMTRHLKRENKEGFPESSTSGRYYDEMQIPIARANAEKAQLLKCACPTTASAMCVESPCRDPLPGREHHIRSARTKPPDHKQATIS